MRCDLFMVSCICIVITVHCIFRCTRIDCAATIHSIVEVWSNNWTEFAHLHHSFSLQTSSCAFEEAPITILQRHDMSFRVSSRGLCVFNRSLLTMLNNALPKWPAIQSSDRPFPLLTRKLTVGRMLYFALQMRCDLFVCRPGGCCLWSGAGWQPTC